MHASDAHKSETRTPELDAHRQLQSRFLSTISHELRTPLTALAGYGELLADEILGSLSPLQHDTVERMRSVTNQLTVMIDSILTFTSLEAGSEKPVITEVDPARIVREVSATVELIAKKKGIELVVSTESIGSFCSDGEKIRQILVYLTDNAVKFTTETPATPPDTPGRVELSVAEVGYEVHFVVRDTGIGISPEQMKHLFLPFVQVDTGLTRRHGGIGLGLYIANRLAGLLNGVIQVESAIGRGSVFRLVIPKT